MRAGSDRLPALHELRRELKYDCVCSPAARLRILITARGSLRSMIRAGRRRRGRLAYDRTAYVRQNFEYPSTLLRAGTWTHAHTVAWDTDSADTSRTAGHRARIRAVAA